MRSSDWHVGLWHLEVELAVQEGAVAGDVQSQRHSRAGGQQSRKADVQDVVVVFLAGHRVSSARKRRVRIGSTKKQPHRQDPHICTTAWQQLAQTLDHS